MQKMPRGGEAEVTWRERMKVGISTAEDQLHAGLVRLKLTKGLFRNRSIPLKPTVNGQKRQTHPDFCWPYKSFAFYLDGPPHETRGGRFRDESITTELEAEGWTVLRAKYRPPLSNKRRVEIEALLMEALTK